MSLEFYIRAMPKVELHVHLEGAIRPETLVKLAERNHVSLAHQTVEGLREWYVYRDFPHFVQIYTTISSCLKTPDDIELIAREFLAGQAAQNCKHSEVTYTAYTIYEHCGISFPDQIAAINRARAWAQRELGVDMTLTMDIAGEEPPEVGLITADWAISAFGNGVSGFGLGGYEMGNPREKFIEAFDRARAAGISSVPHAGETGGPDSIWSAIQNLHADRIGHGVRCIEDLELIQYLREHQIPLEVCPTSNLCFNLFPDLAHHPIQKLLDDGLYITLNSDDPPMFNTTLTDEYLKCAATFGWDAARCETLSLNALRASFLPAERKASLEQEFRAEFARLRAEHHVV
ncbi:MAG TPA: adenosine deaminase [Anaerolineae bacterium]|nr:adenosine deaminase [Anaerolineae bacterium]